MKYDFDKVIDRTGTESLKWVYPRKVLKVEDAIPMWVADMDFEAPPAVVEALRRRVDHGVFGYPLVPPSFYAGRDRLAEAPARLGGREEMDGHDPGHRPGPQLLRSGPSAGRATRSSSRRPSTIPSITPSRTTAAGSSATRSGSTAGATRWTSTTSAPRSTPRAGCSSSAARTIRSGRVWTREELEALGRIAVERDLVVVADEIHHDLVYRGHRHHVLAALSPELAQQTITCIAPSKTFNIAGLTTAAVVAANPDLLKKFEDEEERSGFDLGNALGIVAFEAAYRHGEDWLDELLPYLEANVDLIERFLAERLPGVRLIRPEGTYLALLDCRGLGLEPAALNDFFLNKAGVYFSDGRIFGDEAAGFVRINFGCPRSVLVEALERIERAVKALA